MKNGLICYLTTDGRDRLVRLARQFTAVTFAFHDMSSGELPDLSRYDIVGFVVQHDGPGLPAPLLDFLDRLPPMRGINAFLLDAGLEVPSGALLSMAAAVKRKGFRVVSGHSLTLEEPVRFPGATLFLRFIENLDTFLSGEPTTPLPQPVH